MVARPPNMLTVFQHLRASRDEENFRAILESNPGVLQYKDNDDATLLQLLIDDESEPLALIVLEYCDKEVIDSQDITGQTALHYAIKGQFSELATALLEKGANINIADKENVTSLMVAVTENDFDFVVMLCEYARTHHILDDCLAAKNADNETVIDIARRTADTIIIDHLNTLTPSSNASGESTAGFRTVINFGGYQGQQDSDAENTARDPNAEDTVTFKPKPIR